MSNSISLQLPNDGYIILPISMSRSNNSQSADIYYDTLQQFQQLCDDPTTIDIIILYTTSLYYNNQNEVAWDVKKRLVSQMLSHKSALEHRIRRDDLRLAVHYMTWEEIVLHAPDYQHFYQKLRRAVETDVALYDVAAYSIGNRNVDDASISFLVEEAVLTHILRQKRVLLPKSNVREDTFRLVAYPGPYIAIDFYQWKHKILPQKSNTLFGCSQYNVTKQELYIFDDMPLPTGDGWQRELRITPV
jgi:hypothetical protein